jgi:hypothetical protein
MMKFRRLVESSPHALTRDLLDSAREDAPPAQSAPRIAAALGLAAGVTSAGMPALAVSSGASAALLAGSSKLGVVGVMKWLGAGLLIGTVTSGGAAIVYRGPASTSSSQVPQGTAPRVSPAPRAGAESRAPRAEAPLPAVPPGTPLTASPAPRVARSGLAGEPAVATLPATSALAYEVALIDQARVSLRAGDARGTLTALTRYEEEQQTRVLDREAAVLRIEALRLAGRHSEARELAQRYLDRFPVDAHAAGLRELVRGGQPNPGIDR